MSDFSDDRADKAFIEILKLVAEFRTNNPEYIDTEIAYGLLETVCCVDEGEIWFSFVEEALSECINKEKMALQ